MSRPRCGRCRKVVYTSRESADAARLTMTEQAALNVYRCPSTDGWWHIGHTVSKVGALLALERAMNRPPTTE